VATAKERAEAHSRLLEALPDGVFVGVLTPGSGEPSRTLVTNPAAKRLFGLPPDAPDASVDPFAPLRFANSEDRAAFLDRLANERSVSNYLLRMHRVDNTSVLVDVTAHVHTTEDGRYLVNAVLRDATEHKRLNDRSRELYQQLLQAEKMAALGQTVSGVAHELNNPLATILSWAERLAELPLTDVGRRGVDVIMSEAERAARIVRNLLTSSPRKRPSTRSMVDLNHVIRETLALRDYDQGVREVAVVTALAAGLPPIFADAHQMQQVLLNLTTNAEQAMIGAHGRGSMVVRTWHDAERNVVAMEVTDDGPGIPAEIKSRIFEPFYTTKEVGQGTGLGLTVAYNIVREHGGRIHVESQVGRGAPFVVEIPVSGEALSPVRAAAPAADTRPRARVLLVEDVRSLAETTSDALRRAGFLVDTAGDGEEALARVRQGSYDAIVCDLKMPRVSGMMLYRAIAADRPALARRVIFVTGDVTAAGTERFLAESGCRWLVKPFPMGDLVRTVRDTLA
jgi:two-component system NtrC family sensor kinase